jgi:hypothetical protein
MISECIQIEQIRLTRQRIVPQSISFNLNQVNLEKIELAQASKQQLYLSSTLLADLRYYALLNQDNCCQLELTFRTYYQQQQEKIAVLESVISLDGKIIQQIRSDYLSNISLLKNLTNAHSWLIIEILKQLSLKSKNYSILISISLALVITLLSAYASLVLFSVSFSIQIVGLVTIFTCIKNCSQYWFLPYLRNLIICQLLFGFLSSHSKRRNIGFELLRVLN